MAKTIEKFFDTPGPWQKEMLMLREIVLGCGLMEELKWGVPCYTYNKANILILHGFKEYFALNFFKGALLEDQAKVLVQQTENVQATRQLRMSTSQEITENEKLIKEYIFEAIEIEKAGLKVSYKQASEYNIPEELQNVLDNDGEFKEAFENLTPGRIKGYLLYFSAAKQSKTREQRIANYRDKILSGKGFNDCTCGLSKRLPNCDGSHKQLVK